MRTLFLPSKGSASDIASLYPPVKTGGFIAPSSYPFCLNKILNILSPFALPLHHRHPLSPLDDADLLMAFQIYETIDATGGPIDQQRIDMRGTAQAEGDDGLRLRR